PTHQYPGLALAVPRINELLAQSQLFTEVTRPRLYREKRICPSLDDIVIDLFSLQHAADMKGGFEQRVLNGRAAAPSFLECIRTGESRNASADDGDLVHGFCRFRRARPGWNPSKNSEGASARGPRVPRSASANRLMIRHGLVPCRALWHTF